MKREDFIGKRVAEVKIDGCRLAVIFEDGTSIEAKQGDSGSMRSPEPYFGVDFFPANACRRWSGFGLCVNPKPCQLHDKMPVLSERSRLALEPLQLLPDRIGDDE